MSFSIIMSDIPGILYPSFYIDGAYSKFLRFSIQIFLQFFYNYLEMTYIYIYIYINPTCECILAAIRIPRFVQTRMIITQAT
jgi:hypothetical protein